MRILVLLLCLAPFLSADSLPDLVRDSLRFLDPATNKFADDYAYTVRTTRKQFDPDGNLRSQEYTVAVRTFQDGWSCYRVRERNGKPLSTDEQKQQEARIAKRISELQALPPDEREKERRAGGNARRIEWVREVPEALAFKSVGETVENGRRIVVVDAEPNPNYHARTMQARVLEKMKGKFWIDVEDRELVKAEGETFDSVNIGLGFLGLVEKGTRFSMERRKLADGKWVTANQNIKFGARVMLFKWLRNEIHSEFSDFRHKSVQAASR